MRLVMRAVFWARHTVAGTIMGQGRFLNQKLGKRTSRKAGLGKARLSVQQSRLLRESGRAHKKGASRGESRFRGGTEVRIER
jgi:hypothetical protein